MTRGILSVLLIVFFISIAMTQTIDYYPEQRPGVSKLDYEHGIRILRETYQKVKKDNGHYNYADYWNLAIAYHNLDEGEEAFKKMLYKSKTINPVRFSAIFSIFLEEGGNAEKWSGYITEEEFAALKAEVEMISQREKNKPQDVKSTSSSKLYDEQLVATVKKINGKDQKYRKTGYNDPEKQRILDNENMQAIDKLYAEYQCYIGKSLVGGEYEHVMWAVIQHSNLDYMEHYLPIVHQAVKKGELKEGPLKMLLDRIQVLKEGNQFFGSQPGIPLASKEEIAQIEKRYGFNANPTATQMSPAHRERVRRAKRAQQN